MVAIIEAEHGATIRFATADVDAILDVRALVGVTREAARRLLDSGFEPDATANLENVWNGRPISKIILADPLEVLGGKPVALIQLIPPVHQRVYRMGLEHLGVVVGDGIDEFSRVHRAALTDQQFQSPFVEPYYVLFEDFTHVKFYRHSPYDGCVLEGAGFIGFQHVDDWVPQRIVTATGPNPLPR